ncbi:unnamed protein product [Vitrella brassicaformis CCMP3155]|uniref:Uncharacterized protein n=2 Tax=Vitrella brassicaformis TaxID=1169539 RepID=A0A0G4GV40_VITBC|nr:unnamed protein product [Vitrella brassicaformis CCMP3155]|mmetsp:Transcript_49012/g.122838  ORF Transcript_49012/g.122838 Transcript_49012/m.122838 type:complete len:183 (+) Transcript_49012:36-584(+)|eukprot:CEM34493.1 unnamed protein product [Vitrella brassicaformis CCMP3155]
MHTLVNILLCLLTARVLGHPPTIHCNPDYTPENALIGRDTREDAALFNPPGNVDNQVAEGPLFEVKIRGTELTYDKVGTANQETSPGENTFILVGGIDAVVIESDPSDLATAELSSGQTNPDDDGFPVLQASPGSPPAPEPCINEVPGTPDPVDVTITIATAAEGTERVATQTCTAFVLCNI